MRAGHGVVLAAVAALAVLSATPRTGVPPAVASAQAATVAFVTTEVTATEAGGNATVAVEVTVTEAFGAGDEASVRYATLSGSAHSGKDFDASVGTITIDADTDASGRVAIVVHLAADGVYEGGAAGTAETFTVMLLQATGGAVVPQGAAVATVSVVDSDDDAACAPLSPAHGNVRCYESPWETGSQGTVCQVACDRQGRSTQTGMFTCRGQSAWSSVTGVYDSTCKPYAQLNEEVLRGVVHLRSVWTEGQFASRIVPLFRAALAFAVTQETDTSMSFKAAEVFVDAVRGGDARDAAGLIALDVDVRVVADGQRSRVLYRLAESSAPTLARLAGHVQRALTRAGINTASVSMEHFDEPSFQGTEGKKIALVLGAMGGVGVVVLFRVLLARWHAVHDHKPAAGDAEGASGSDAEPDRTLAFKGVAGPSGARPAVSAWGASTQVLNP